jgi:hypothetical protein
MRAPRKRFNKRQSLSAALIALLLGPLALVRTTNPQEAKLTNRAAFPEEYSLNRPLLRNNPRALLAGDDWQGMLRTTDLKDCRIYINKWNRGTSGRAADASTVDVPHTPGAKRAEIAEDPTFGRAVQLWPTTATGILRPSSCSVAGRE